MLRAGWRMEDVAYAMGFHGPSKPSELLRQAGAEPGIKIRRGKRATGRPSEHCHKCVIQD
ncbi:hypothetical protein QJS10_CPA05g01657 [Acorus calamus]|uniref:Uncharacterized protein n=1 Tax=Acorus calamus TaxID=4465 RepID=A0AAV9EVE2_ACOCL|nr:hypothetical protein QJS10_CPA05g01657 [Acorus calamus]